MKTPLKAMLATALGTVAFAAGLSPLMAQQSGQVNVDVSDIKADIAKNINVDVSRIPASVQVPIGVAANVCNVAANDLASSAQGQAASCKAASTNAALNQIVQRDLGANAPAPK